MDNKWFITVLFLLLIASMYASTSSFSHNPRAYSQQIISPKTDIMKIVTNTGATHNENYVIEATCSSSPGQVLTTALPNRENPMSLRIFSIRRGNFQKAFCFVQLAEFQNPVEPGDEIHCKVTYIGKGKYHNQSTFWDYFIPEGDASITVMGTGNEQVVPPVDKKTLDKQKK